MPAPALPAARVAAGTDDDSRSMSLMDIRASSPGESSIRVRDPIDAGSSKNRIKR